MVTLEQIKLLESKITKAVNFVGQLTDENTELKKRNKELEETIAALQEEKSRVQEGIVSALGKLNQFEDAIERSLSSVKNSPKPVQSSQNAGTSAPAQPASPPQSQAASQPVSPVSPLQAAPLPASPQPAPRPAPVPAAKPQPAVPSAYTVDEEPEENSEAELDIF